MARATCLNGECGKYRHARGLCQDCYNTRRRAGQPMPLPPLNTARAVPPPITREAAARRYAQFLALTQDGKTAQEIAAALRIGVRTVERYRQGLRHQQEQITMSTSPQTPPTTPPPAPRADRTPDLSAPSNRVKHSKDLLNIATRLACMVRDEDGDAVAAYLATLTPTECAHLPIVMAALIPVDRTVDDLLSWITWDEHGNPLPTKRPAKKPRAGTRPKAKLTSSRPQRGVKPCGTYAASLRHKKRREPMCDRCADAYSKHRAKWRRDYEATRKATAA